MTAEYASVKISVVMSVYNGEKYLREAIDSILSQTFHDFEFIIIDDGSNDGSAEVVRSYTDSRIRFVQQENRGLAAALNRGVSLAHSDLIARMDQDDISMPERFDRQYQYLSNHPKVVALGAATEWIDEKGASVCVIPPPNIEQIFDKDVLTSPFFHPTVVFKRDAFDLIGGYPEGFKFAPEDAVFFKRMHEVGRLENLEDVLLKYRLTPNSLSLGHSLNKKMMFEMVKKELSGTIAKKDYDLIQLTAKSISPRIRMSAYHGLIARKYLWDSSTPEKAKEHILKAISNNYFQLMLYIIFFACFLPNDIVRKIKHAIKKPLYKV